MKKLVALLLALVLGRWSLRLRQEGRKPPHRRMALSRPRSRQLPRSPKARIGITLPTQELARCLKDQEYLTQYLNERGYDVDVQFAKGDAATQVAQMENMITNGVVGIICSPWDGSALTSAVEAAHNAGIPVIAL